MSDTVLLRSIADALQEGHAISQRVSAKALHDAADEIERLQGLVAKGLAVVHDFLPNIGRCVLQDYQRMNEFCAEAVARAAKDEYSILAIYEKPDGTQERVISANGERYVETSGDGLHWRRATDEAKGSTP